MSAVHYLSSKVFVVILDIILLGLGIGLLGIGIWFRVEQSAKDSREVLDHFLGEDLSDSTSWLIIAIGIGITIVAVCGLVGALFDVKFLLALFAVFIVALIVLEAAACGLAAVFRENLFADLRYNMEMGIEGTYYTNTTGEEKPTQETGRPWDFLQSTFDCCGVYSFYDYNSFSDKYGIPFPYSCCSDIVTDDEFSFSLTRENTRDASSCFQMRENYFNAKGCYVTLVDFTESNIVIILGVAIAVACFNIFLFIFAICLCWNIENVKEPEMHSRNLGDEQNHSSEIKVEDDSGYL